ncbi:MAG TPA: GGDEF domain-containing protein [Terriglobales bacterium]|nr:GGDEF domain-containing protein [Terriglobales bacterium]
MDVYHKGSLKGLFLPGGALLLVAAVVLQTGVIPIAAQALDFYYFAVFSIGLLLAWRFHSSRVCFTLLTLLLGHHAIEFFSAGHMLGSRSGHIAFEAVALLIPINLIALSIAAERGFILSALASRLCLIFLEAVFVAVICRPGETTSPWFVHLTLLDRRLFAWTGVPQPALLAFVVAGTVLLVRFRFHRKPVEHGLIWSLAAAFAGLHAGAVGQVGSAYFATAGLILVVSLVENSYFLAYHDELTALPARRAFNDALLGLEPPYTVTVVDIDHFKKVNDIYGHDTGDQVLSMVAAHLAGVGSRGDAYRVGGEEFSILFPGKTVKEVLPALETLRLAIAESSFRTRIAPERRRSPRGPDRRQMKTGALSNARRTSRAALLPGLLSVTVSIGVAESNARTRGVDEVIEAADKALYRAKRGGRNRVEIATSRLELARRAASR